ncbi:hypothetical protein ACHMW7_08960 [Aminobacter sp. UC22_36]|uniref:hypothetical protein n=1 Tax=Aminobacter sp. UC22_36 TaxID=3374549 RepID=UPI003757B36B
MEHQIERGAIRARAGTGTAGVRAKHAPGKRAEGPGTDAQGRRRSNGGAMTRLELPFPVPQRVSAVRPTLRHQAWTSEAAAAIAGQRPVKGEVSVYVRLVAPDRAACDLGTLATCILDTLWAHGLIEGSVRRLSLEWAEHGPACVVLIQPGEAA